MVALIQCSITFRKIQIYKGTTEVSEKCPKSTQVSESVTGKVLC